MDVLPSSILATSLSAIPLPRYRVFPLRVKVHYAHLWNPARKKANLADLHWHDLRHTFASRLIMAGVDLRTVQELMGRKTITMTLRYTHLSPTHQREAVQRLLQEPTAIRTAITPKVD